MSGHVNRIGKAGIHGHSLGIHMWTMRTEGTRRSTELITEKIYCCFFLIFQTEIKRYAVKEVLIHIGHPE